MKTEQLSRAKVRDLRIAALAGDRAAARSLLAHSVALNHDRLSVRRYAVARLLGAEGLEEFRPFCARVAAGMPAQKLRSILRDLTKSHPSELDIESLIDELAPAPEFYSCSFAGIAPSLAGPPASVGKRSAVLGRVTLGTGAVIGAGAVIRADGHFVRIGNGFVLGSLSTVHIAHDLYPTVIGNDVAVGRNAIVHACTVGDRCVIRDDAIVLDGSLVEDDVLLECGSVVFPRSKLEAGHVYSGSPARAVRKLAPGELAKARREMRDQAMRLAGDEPARDDRAHAGFVAQTALVEGEILLGARASIFFGCRLDGRAGPITVGDNTNVQDNSRISAAGGGVTIGENTTIGHNVAIDSSRVGAGSLIGMGSVLSPGTHVADDVLLAAGSITTAGQVLESGWLWGGRPAARMKPLDEARRAMMRNTISQYCDYADQYRQADL